MVEPDRDEGLIDLNELAEYAVRRGWHDSSMDLRRGLDILEDLPMDTLPDDLRETFENSKR